MSLWVCESMGCGSIVYCLNSLVSKNQIFKNRRKLEALSLSGKKFELLKGTILNNTQLTHRLTEYNLKNVLRNASYPAEGVPVRPDEPIPCRSHGILLPVEGELEDDGDERILPDM